MTTQDDVLGYFDTLSNWGRWGDDDQLGTLNHITDGVRLAAAPGARIWAAPGDEVVRPRISVSGLRWR
jgi:hypothetical protein